MTKTIEQPHAIRFANTHRDFVSTLNKRVNQYFTTNKLNRHANNEMIIKTFFMFALYFVPYGLVILGVVTNPFLLALMVVLMAFGLSGIGLSVMHDANHGAYSRKKWINSFIGYSLNLVGANA